MSFEEKGHWVVLITTIIAYGTYATIILGQLGTTALTEVSYVPTMLWAIGATIVLSIIGMIAVAISKPSEADKKDARDKEINRFGEYVGGIVLGALMIAPFIFAIAEFDHFWIANAMYASFVLSGIVSAIVKIVKYRKGL